MRTTLQIDDDVLAAARTLAAEQHSSLGRVVSDLARKGLRPSSPLLYENGFPVFEVRENAPLFGPGDVDAALEES